MVKVSDHELLADGRIQADRTDQLICRHAPAERRRRQGRHRLPGRSAITRCLPDHELIQVTPPTFEVADTSGAGDSLTAGVAASLATAGQPDRRGHTGAAAGALNVTRHGRGTGDAEAITSCAKLVRVRTVGSEAESAAKLSPAELASHMTEKPGGSNERHRSEHGEVSTGDTGGKPVTALITNDDGIESPGLHQLAWPPSPKA